jgi:hypothetical protein
MDKQMGKEQRGIIENTIINFKIGVNDIGFVEMFDLYEYLAVHCSKNFDIKASDLKRKIRNAIIEKRGK